MHSALRTLITFGTLATLALPASADDMPKRKSGLWQVKTSHAGVPDMTMQVCIVQDQDDLTADQADREARRHCPKMAVKRSGNRIEMDSVCVFDRTTATSHAVVTGSLASDYRMESTTRFEPPMEGMPSSHMVMTGRWLGPCKPGQKHGAMLMDGLPGGGRMDLDPALLRQLEQMQRQYGR